MSPKFLGAATLLQNGYEAQQLNTLFKTLEVTDSCNTGNKACLLGGVAICRNGVWSVGQGQCGKSQQCVALPSNTEKGILVTCTTEESAVKAFEESGAQGGLFGLGSGSSANTKTSNQTQGSKHSSLGHHNGNMQSNGKTKSSSPSHGDEDNCNDDKFTIKHAVTRTAAAKHTTATKHSIKTITAKPSKATVTSPIIFTVTRTLSPEVAMEELMGLLAEGATIMDAPVPTAFFF